MSVEEPTDCLFACDECKVDTCIFHNRAPVLLSVYEQDQIKAETDAIKRAAVEATAPQSPSPSAESQVLPAKDSSVETTARLDTGCSRRNFIQQDLADELISRGSKVVAVEGGIEDRFSDEPNRVYIELQH